MPLQRAHVTQPGIIVDVAEPVAMFRDQGRNLFNATATAGVGSVFIAWFAIGLPAAGAWLYLIIGLVLWTLAVQSMRSGIFVHQDAVIVRTLASSRKLDRGAVAGVGTVSRTPLFPHRVFAGIRARDGRVFPCYGLAVSTRTERGQDLLHRLEAALTDWQRSGG